jgi:hypothetical protein
MGHGGRRENAGRPTREEAAEKARLLAEAIASGAKKMITPTDYLQGVLNSAGSSKSERLRACELLLKRPLDALPAASHAATEIRVLVIPRGAQLRDGQVIWPDGELVGPLQPAQPFRPTSWVSKPERRRAELEPEPERLPVHEPADADNIVRLRPHAGGADDDEPEPGAA